MTMMTNNDLVSVAMPAIAAAAVLMTGGVVAYWATHRRQPKLKTAKPGLGISPDTVLGGHVAAAELHRTSVAQSLKDIREAVEDAERLLVANGHAREKT
jgi:hypothetical protein